MKSEIENLRLEMLKSILRQTDSKSKRAHSLWLILTYYTEQLSTSDLFSFLPFIWQIDLEPKYYGSRNKLEDEIKRRQDDETITNLLNLLKSKDENLRFAALDLLIHFDNTKILKPVLDYLHTIKDDFWTKRLAIIAIQDHKSQDLQKYLRG